MSATLKSSAPAEARRSTYGIGDRLPRRRVSIVYAAAIAATAVAMIALPVAYVAMIAGVGWGGWWYLLNGYTWVAPSGGWGVIMLYVAPLFACGTLIAFMVKPLFAKKPPIAEPITIDLADHPELQHLLHAICLAVGAPMPVQVDIDCQVNASARLKRGWLSLGRRELVLTIGLPLVKGLTTRQLAGILAHELAHFAQNAGMASSYAIRSVNGWFARVVFGRDRLDAALEHGSEAGNYWGRFIVSMARFAVLIARYLLRGLMYVGNAISCVQLRQMEYDADYYEVALVGSATYVATAIEVRRIDAAARAAYADAHTLLQRRRTVADICDLIARRRALFTSDNLRHIDEAGMTTPTRWLDTHPSDAARRSQAEALALSGILTAEGDATSLFHDFSALCRRATRHFYVINGVTVDENAAIDASVIEQTVAHEDAAEQARVRLTATVVNITRPVCWSSSDFTAYAGTPAELTAELAECRTSLREHQPKATAAEKTYGNIRENLTTAEVAKVFLRAQLKINPRAFNLAAADLAEAETDAARLIQAIAATAQDIAPFESAMHRWVVLVGSAARAEFADAMMGPEERNDLVALTGALGALRPWVERFPLWFEVHQKLAAMAANEKMLGKETAFNQLWRDYRERAAALIEEAPTLVGAAVNPLVSDARVTIAESLASALQPARGDARLVVLLHVGVGIYFRTLARIALRGEQLENRLGATPAAEG